MEIEYALDRQYEFGWQLVLPQSVCGCEYVSSFNGHCFGPASEGVDGEQRLSPRQESYSVTSSTRLPDRPMIGAVRGARLCVSQPSVRRHFPF